MSTVTYEEVDLSSENLGSYEPEVEDVPPDTRSGLICEECSGSIVWAGRGRKPKRCHTCRGNRTPSRSSGNDSAGNRRGSLKALEENLTAQLYSIGALVAMFDQFDGVLIAQKSNRVASALTDVAATNPQIRRALERSLQVSGWGQVLMVVGEVALPIMAHHGLLPGVPDPAQAFFKDGAGNVTNPV